MYKEFGHTCLGIYILLSSSVSWQCSLASPSTCAADSADLPVVQQRSEDGHRPSSSGASPGDYWIENACNTKLKKLVGHRPFSDSYGWAKFKFGGTNLFFWGIQ